MDKNVNRKPQVKAVSSGKVNNNDKKKMTVEDKLTIKELEGKIQSMIEDRDRKCESAKAQLVEMLKITVDKYRTATGTAEALRTLRFVCGSDEVPSWWANKLAWDMAHETELMHKKASQLGYAEMDKLCDGFYDTEFTYDPDEDFGDGKFEYKLAFEMMRIDLCRNVGPSAEDLVSFIDRVQDEIRDTQAKLDELYAKEK